MGGLRRQAGGDLRAGLAPMCVAREWGGFCKQTRARYTSYINTCAATRTLRRRPTEQGRRADGGCESVFSGDVVFGT